MGDAYFAHFGQEGKFWQLLWLIRVPKLLRELQAAHAPRAMRRRQFLRVPVSVRSADRSALRLPRAVRARRKRVGHA